MEPQYNASIIIPCYNQAEFLAEALDSATGQTSPEFEIVVVDDGSTPDQARRISELSSSHTLVRQPNRGLSAARNSGIGVARGKYIVCLDSDDLLMPHYMQSALPLASESAVVCPGLHMFGERDKVCRPVHPLSPGHDGKRPLVLFMNPLFQSSLFPRAAWAHVGGYDEGMRDGYEDWEFWIRLAKAGLEFRLLDEPLYWYRVREGSMITESERRHEEILRQMRGRHPEMP